MVSAENLPHYALDSVPARRVRHLLGDRDPEASQPLGARQHHEHEVLGVHSGTVALDTEELPAPTQTMVAREALVVVERDSLGYFL